MTAARFVGLFVVGLAAGGCSISFPIMGLSGSDEKEVAMTTASLPASPQPGKNGALASLSRELGPEDIRRADGALALALDPQGNGAAVGWDNPQSGAKGSFAPVGLPFVKADEICRDFSALANLQSGTHRLKGRACRAPGGDWAVLETSAIQG